MTNHKMLLGVGLALTILTPLSSAQAQNINFGDNLSQWANDGECDDPRFAGNGMADILLDDDIAHDANDCRQLLSKGRISVIPAPSKGIRINFGDNTSAYANDGECDDPRFGGPGTAATLLAGDLGRDANDCRTLLQQGQVFILNDVGIDTFIPSNVHFGDNSSAYANNGECDDPRFEGRYMADILLDEDTAHDANDCRMLFESAQIAVVGQGNITSTINFGDDASNWAHDGECDDPRFDGAGAAAQPLNENIGHDATDCRMLMQQGLLLFDGQRNPTSTPKGNAQINFGDNTSTWAHDDECDDPRFSGSAMASILLDEDVGHDAADCQYLYQSNQIEYIGGGSNTGNQPPQIGQGSNLIQNGSFEQATAGLTVTDGVQGWRIVRDNIDVVGSNYWTAPHGALSIDLTGTPGSGAIQQSFPTTPGKSYNVQFSIAGSTGCSTGDLNKSMRVSAAGQSAEYSDNIQSFSNSNMNWQRYSWNFTANSRTSTLMFQATDQNANCGMALDNVVVTAN